MLRSTAFISKGSMTAADFTRRAKSEARAVVTGYSENGTGELQRGALCAIIGWHKVKNIYSTQL
jgi:hypothetical protein